MLLAIAWLGLGLVGMIMIQSDKEMVSDIEPLTFLQRVIMILLGPITFGFALLIEIAGVVK